MRATYRAFRSLGHGRSWCAVMALIAWASDSCVEAQQAFENFKGRMDS